MHIDVQSLIHHYGYAGVFLILLVEMVGIPFPAETTLTLSGIAWTQGAFSLLPLLLVAVAGNVAGSSIAFMIGRYFGRPVIVKYGKYVGLTHERFDQAQERFHRYQSVVVLVAKFIAGIRVLVPYLAGIEGMSFAWFTFYNTLSSLVWATVFIFLGKYIGVEWHRYHQVIQTYFLPILLVVIILVILYGWLHWRGRRSRHKKR